MNCSGYERQMSDYLDGQLSKATEDELRFHLNGCPRCRLRIQEMESAMRAVKSLPAVSPRPMFEDQLGNLLSREVARELYASSWLRRVSAAFSELGELSRQRPVQLVFATSLILTITVIGGFAEVAGPTESSDSSAGSAMAFSLPTPIEPELAPPDPISPFPLERELAPHLAIEPAMNTEQATNPSNPVATSLPYTTNGITGDRPGILTVRTMEPMTHGIRFVTAGTGMRLDPSLIDEAFGRDLVAGGDPDRPAPEDLLQTVGTAERRDSQRAVGTTGAPGAPASSGPTAPLKRVRISF
ncbi:MAG: zf-HC2 domain-containing protein [candidate division Zixibacteria bacterium]|nr:zf-HC2 domain-containing protein [candidate division Zixibacteria bacterium]